ncbi:hypothetical protein [Pseudonocardia sp. NPDC049635]|uniref:hypothetical protein n=1 Tax=Pseudonocardia sp. NPDC049635 TaxID=3155506 RepID=UPI0033E8404D
MTAADELRVPTYDADAVDAVAERVAALISGQLNTGDLAQRVAGQLATDTVAERVAALVTAQLGGAESDCWWETSQVMAYTGHGRTLVATDQADGRLHSHQRGRQGRRYTKRSVVDAWMQGATPEQQAQVCGCAQLARWKATA